MGLWGLGPMECDDAGDFTGGIRSILDEAWAPLREGARDPASLERASDAAAVVIALGEFGIDVLPQDADDLGELDDLPEVVTAALSMDFPRGRPPFGPEGAVEKHLRECGASYELWNRAAQFGDDRHGLLHALTDPDQLLRFVQAYGVTYEDVQHAIAAMLVDSLDTSVYAEPPFDVVPGMIAAVARRDAVDQRLIERCSNQLRAINEALDRAMHERLAAGQRPEKRDGRITMLGFALDLAEPRRRHVTRWYRPLRWLVEDIPDLTARLRERLGDSSAFRRQRDS